MIKAKRIYEKADVTDGYRVLVDRLWPRGMRKSEAKLDGWVKDLAPSAELRKWFEHDPEKWPEFKRRYFEELDKHPKFVNEFIKTINQRKVTFLFSSKELKLNNALALKEYVEKKSKS